MLYTNSPKKLLIINILDILRKYTDADHRLSQKDIMDILRTEYQMSVDRKTVKRNLMNLIEFGCNIEYSEAIRMIPNSRTGELEESSILSDFYLVRDFTDSELRLLIDSLLFSKHIPYSHCRELIEKLEGLSNQYFRSHMGHVRNMPDNAPQSKQLFYTIEVLDEAISKGRQVSLIYSKYGIDKKLHPTLDEAGKPKRQIINPYQMAATNGRYYLICNNEKYDSAANYRLDRIKDVQLLDTPRKPMKKVQGLENGLDLPKHMAEHVYMFSGESAPVRMRVKKHIVGEVIDWFGKDVEFYDEGDDEVCVRVKVNLNAMRRWALQYALYATVIAPEELVEQIREDVKEAGAKYGV